MLDLNDLQLSFTSPLIVSPGFNKESSLFIRLDTVFTSQMASKAHWQCHAYFLLKLGSTCLGCNPVERKHEEDTDT